MSDIFVSYASADREKAKVLAEALETHGWSVWWDRNIPPGRQFDEVIEEALDAARCVIVLWSKASITSTWVKTEAADAMRRKILVPVLIEDVRIPLEFRRLQAADLSNWTGDHLHSDLNTLLHSLESQVGRSENRPTVTSSVATQIPAESPSGPQQFADSAIARVGGLSKHKLALPATLVAGILVAAIVGYRIIVGRSGGEGAGSEAPPSAQTQNTTGAGVWLADAKGCKVWDSSPKPKESVTWSGSCLKGKADGTGTAEWFVDGQRHERMTGRFSEGKADGPVTAYDYASGTTYEGSFNNGVPIGKVTLTTSKEKIEGNLVDGKLSGNVVITSANGERYEGEQRDLLRNGKGELTLPNGIRYVGNFVNGKFQGLGNMTWPSGNHYEGAFQGGDLTGKGTLTFANGNRYVGDFVHGKFQGYGILTTPGGNRYEGDFRDGQRTGKGIETLPNGVRYVGEFVDGKYHGRGVLTTAKGQHYEGNFIAGQIAR